MRMHHESWPFGQNMALCLIFSILTPQDLSNLLWWNNGRPVSQNWGHRWPLKFSHSNVENAFWRGPSVHGPAFWNQNILMQADARALLKGCSDFVWRSLDYFVFGSEDIILVKNRTKHRKRDNRTKERSFFPSKRCQTTYTTLRIKCRRSYVRTTTHIGTFFSLL